jgi:hypothetical protein
MLKTHYEVTTTKKMLKSKDLYIQPALGLEWNVGVEQEFRVQSGSD